MKNAQNTMLEMLSKKLDVAAPNLLSHFVAQEGGFDAMKDYITNFTTAFHPTDELLTWVFLCRAIVSGVDSGTVPHRPFNAIATRELDALRVAAAKRLASDHQAELDALTEAIERIESVPAPPPPKTREEIDEEANLALIHEYRTGSTSELKKKLRQDPALAKRFDRLSAAGRMVL